MVQISAQVVKQLREKTGAGMMDCKKALLETDGDITQAITWLRQKIIYKLVEPGLKTMAQGMIGSYIHTGGNVGVLVEVNCDTDFVSRTAEFQNLVRNIAMQVAASANVEYVRVADIPAQVVEKEKAIEIGRDDLGNKPEVIKEKIVQGRIEKRLKEMCLMDQLYIRDQSITVEQLVNQATSQFGENIQIRRFVRFVLGESQNIT